MNTSSDQIDLIHILKNLWNRKYFIIFWTGLISLASVLIALNLQNYYTSSSKLSVAEDDYSNTSSALSQYSGLASMAGVSLPGSEDQSSYILAKLHSLDFLDLLLEKNSNIVPSIIAPGEYNHEDKNLIINPKKYNIQTKEWVRSVAPPYSSIPSLEEIFKEFHKIMSIEQDKKTKIITISAEHISPIFSQEIVQMTIQTFNQYSKDKDINEANRALNFLRNESQSIEIKDINSTINSLIKVQLNKLMTAEMRENYSLEIIDPPNLPQKKSAPIRSIICIIAFLFGIISSILWVTISKYILYPLKEKKL